MVPCDGSSFELHHSQAAILADTDLLAQNYSSSALSLSVSRLVTKALTLRCKKVRTHTNACIIPLFYSPPSFGIGFEWGSLDHLCSNKIIVYARIISACPYCTPSSLSRPTDLNQHGPRADMYVHIHMHNADDLLPEVFLFLLFVVVVVLGLLHRLRVS